MKYSILFNPSVINVWKEGLGARSGVILMMKYEIDRLKDTTKENPKDS